MVYSSGYDSFRVVAKHFSSKVLTLFQVVVFEILVILYPNV